jgi:hypothetical protein
MRNSMAQQHHLDHEAYEKNYRYRRQAQTQAQVSFFLFGRHKVSQ